MITGINTQIRTLIADQTDLRTLALKQDIDDAANQPAIKALNAASKKLTIAAGTI